MDRSQSLQVTAARPAQQKINTLHRQRNQRERWLMIGTVSIIIAAWLYGYFNSGTDATASIGKVLPGAATIERSGDLFIGRNVDGDLVGYAAVGSGSGYAGPLEVAVGVDPAGSILGVEMVAERESPGFFRLVRNSKLFTSYIERQIQDPLQLGQDLDTITGATMSAEGVANAVREAVRHIAANGLQTPLPPQTKRITVGLPEVILILLFASGYVGHKLRNPRAKRVVRWGTLIAGMVTIGFIYTLPLTISMVVSVFSGYWPDWQTNLYWYLLIGGILFVTTVDAKNPYCSWFCPFGAFQECLAAVSKAKAYRPRDLNVALMWLQRGLALTAIVLGLALRQPGAAGYEPFATLFDLRGTPVQWALLIIVVLASLMMYRPFCNYLCPLDPVVDFIAAGRRWIKETWKTWQKQPLKQEKAPASEG
jgi:NosR/NirI family transcriptional regulator, nitrous oxide reductase regulator